METKNKIISVEAPSDLGNRMIRFCISAEVQDRDDDILIASGCDFSNFAKNPQFLGFHNYWDFPLGTPKKWWVDNVRRRVYADVYFPTLEELSGGRPELASEKAKQVDFTYNCYKTGMLSAVSVGFKVLEWEKNPNSERGWVISKWELLEFSAVPIPANPDALADAVKSFDPSGKMMEVFMEVETKAGRRFSKATLEAIEGIKACHKIIREQSDKLDSIMVSLLEQKDEEEPEEPFLEVE